MLSSLRIRNFSMQTDLFARSLFGSSSPLVTVPLPSPRETHFWYMIPDEVQSGSLLDQYVEIISPYERDNVFRMKCDALRKRALLARVLVRTTLARYSNFHAGPRSLKFRKNVFGKPEVVWQHDDNWDPPPLHFNISHTSSLIACGVTVDMPIGIDVEEKQRKIRNSISSFARRYFSPREVEFLDAFSDPEIQRQEFIKLWTLKEAYVKALGRGFSAAPFRTFTIQLMAGKHMQNRGEFNSDAIEIVVEAIGNPENLTTNWQFALFELANSHYASICMEKDGNINGKGSSSLRLKVWKTLPFVEDECVSGTDAVATISGV
ncbi:uncharacterized protein LOC143879697 [Tasmannia lanceolata]|uniref:uncharacterized protein LOC143879697 n=1 Tax=Tasmannia lanceolata TaxID=3420 RepID=UPI004063E98A